MNECHKNCMCQDINDINPWIINPGLGQNVFWIFLYTVIKSSIQSKLIVSYSVLKMKFNLKEIEVNLCWTDC